MITGYVV